MALNGVYLDSIDSYNGAYWDPRVPRLNFLNKPQAFIIGLSADGIIKSVKRLPEATVVGVEIHPTIFRTMTEDGPFAQWAARPYDNAEVHLAEGRSYLANNDRLWDMIFLMNIHPEHGPVNTYSPENMHTVEGVKFLLSKLTERGILVFEEIIQNNRGELAFQKLLNTCKEALPANTDKADCFYIFRWDFWSEASIFRTLILKAKPFTKNEIAELDYYFEKIKERYLGTEMVYHPVLNLNTEYEKVIRNKKPFFYDQIPSLISGQEYVEKILNKLNDPREIEFLSANYTFNGRNAFYKNIQNQAEQQRLISIFKKIGFPVKVDLSPATDDKPFPYAVYQEKAEIVAIIEQLGILVAVLGLVIFALLFGSNQAPFKVFLPSVLFALLSGFAYMLVEIVLMQRFQLFLGNPNWNLLVVLGGMLVASGLGSLVVRFLPRFIILLISLLIPFVLFFYPNNLEAVFLACGHFSLENKLLVSFFIISPIAFLMGMPFPSAIELVKLKAFAGFAALLFGISGAASTMAYASSLYVNVEQGFSASFKGGILLYTLAFFFFIWIFLITLRKRKTNV